MPNPGWSQHQVAPAGSSLFATIGVVADRSLRAKETSAPSTPSHHTVEARSGSPSLQHVLAEFPKVLNTSKVLPKPTHRVEHFLVTEGRHSQVQKAGQQQVGGRQEGVCRAGETGHHQEIQQQLGFSSTYGEEGRWHVEAMWGL